MHIALAFLKSHLQELSAYASKPTEEEIEEVQDYFLLRARCRKLAQQFKNHQTLIRDSKRGHPHVFRSPKVKHG